MTDEEKKVFSLRISQSNKTEIVVITYEIILNYIQSANVCFGENDFQGTVRNLQKTKHFINDLISNLDLKYAISYELLNLYRYSNKIIQNCIIKRNMDNMQVVEHIMSSLMKSFAEVAKQDTRGAAIQSGVKVIAGLTYGNNSKLNEVCYSFDKKGFLG